MVPGGRGEQGASPGELHVQHWAGVAGVPGESVRVPGVASVPGAGGWTLDNKLDLWLSIDPVKPGLLN